MAAEPYRPHFLIGLALGIAGVSLWPLYQLNLIAYPILAHRHLMIYGLFVSFVSGFLMTAGPRMSGTEPATPAETYISVVLILASSVAALLGWNSGAGFFAIAQILSLLMFLGRRMLRRQHNPPLGFIFVPFGLLWLIYGTLSAALNLALPLELTAIEQAFLLNLIVGIGSRLIPFLSRAANIHPGAAADPVRKDLIALALALNFGFVLTAFIPSPITSGFVFVVLALSAWQGLALFKPMHSWTAQGAGIRLSVYAMLAAQLALTVYPDNRINLLHVMFIGGYALITFMIATRVVLAHGGHSLAPEIKSPWLIGLIFLLIITALARADGLLTEASAIWVVACLIWFWEVGRKALTSGRAAG